MKKMLALGAGIALTYVVLNNPVVMSLLKKVATEVMLKVVR